MPHPDDHQAELDRLLLALVTPPIPLGMEARVQQRLAQTTQAPRRTWRLPVFAFAGVTAAAVFLLSHPQSKKLEPPAGQPATLAHTMALPTPPQPVVTPVHYAQTSLKGKRGHVFAPSTPAEAASFPPPPLPLTDQERLLLRIARRRDPQQIAALDPIARERLDALDSAQFEQFFTPPPPPPDPTPEPRPTGDPQWHPASN